MLILQFSNSPKILLYREFSFRQSSMCRFWNNSIYQNTLFNWAIALGSLKGPQAFKFTTRPTLQKQGRPQGVTLSIIFYKNEWERVRGREWERRWERERDWERIEWTRINGTSESENNWDENFGSFIWVGCFLSLEAEDSDVINFNWKTWLRSVAWFVKATPRL